MQFLNAHLRTGRPDADTLIVLLVIWFLLADGSFVQTDLLIFVVVLLLLGL